MAMPLDGIRIVDWTSGQFGPVATSMLGDLGADVIKVESPTKWDPARDMSGPLGRSISGMPPGPNYFYENNNRSKRSITVDVTRQEGREIVYRLVKTADVFVNTYRQPVAARVGLAYETLLKYNPKLIYAAGNAFGPLGPDCDKPGLDYVTQARCGIMAAVGEPGMPPLVAEGTISDQISALVLGYAVLAALLARERLGISQKIHVSLLGSMVFVQGVNVAAYTMLGAEAAKHKRSAAGNPLWNHYKCADGKWLAFAMLWSDRCWPDFCRIMDIQHLQNDPKFISMEARRRNAEELVAILDNIMIARPRHEWIKILDEASAQGADIIYSLLNSISDLPDDPQIIANDYITTFDHPVLGNIKVVGVPYKFSETPAMVGGSRHREAPALGAHNEEILLELGYTRRDIAALKKQAVI